MKHTLIALLFFLLIISCGRNNDKDGLPETFGIDVTDMDTTLHPGDDFYTYVNGGWLSRTSIPPTEGRWGSFHELRERTLSDVYTVMKEAEASTRYPEGSDYRKAIDFFSVGMDSMRAEAAGVKPLAGYFQQINAIASGPDLQGYLVEQQKIGSGAFFRILVRSDLKESNMTALYIAPDGLGLPEREYYLLNDDKSKEIRERYVQHVSRMLELTGLEKVAATHQAMEVMDIEKRLAGAMLKKEDRRNPEKIYNKRSADQLAAIMPSIAWADYFSALGAGNVDSVIVADLGFLAEMERIIRRPDASAIKSYLRWHLINSASPYLNHACVSEDFKFYSGYLGGVTEMRPRWKRVLASLDAAVGDAVGQLYVEKNFPPEAKKKALQMVQNIRLAFAQRIKVLDWMSDSTKQKALDKLSQFNVKIAYPDEWRDYAGLAMEREPETAS